MPSAIVVQVGDPLRLECQVVGSPEPEIFWDIDGRSIGDFHGIEVTFSDGKVSLIIPNVRPDHGGLYKCVATNFVGSIETCCKVIIDGDSESPVNSSEPEQVKVEENRSEQDSVLVEASVTPKFKVIDGLKSHSLMEGQSLTLEAVIVGEPKPEVRV